MTHRLLNLLTALSLLLCIAAVVLWVRGRSTADQFDALAAWNDGERERSRAWGLASMTGRLILYRNEAASDPDRDAWWEFAGRFGHEERGLRHYQVEPGAETSFAHESFWNQLGFEYADRSYRFSPRVSERSRQAVAPAWAVTLILAALPCASARREAQRLFRQSRHHRRLCPRCGYDLRATPGRCPECGAAAAEV